MTPPDSAASLRWVHKNRTRSQQRASSVSAAITNLARAMATQDGGRLAEASEVLDEVVDADFREKCSLAALQGGTLRVEVVAPCWISAMQRRWADGLMRTFRERAPRLGVRRIQFEFGLGGRSMADRSLAGSRRPLGEKRSASSDR